jgi:hypothetical protein
MPNAENSWKSWRGPVQLVLIFALLQLLVTLLTDGFCLSFDEAMWHYIGRNWFRHGLVPYTGGIDNKSPLIFAIYGFSDMVFGVNYWFPRVLGTICQSFGLFLLFRMTDQLAGRRAALMATTMYGLSLLWRSTDGKLVSLSETYSVVCIIASFYKYFQANRGRDFFRSGLIAGVGLGFRLSAGFGGLAILMSSFRRNGRSAVAFLSGMLASGTLLLAIAYICGIPLRGMLFYGFLDNFGSGSATDHTPLWKLENFFSGFFYSELLLFYPALLGYFIVGKRRFEVTAWLICAFIGVNVIGIYARPHFKELLPVMSLAGAMSLDALIEQYGIPPRQIMIMIWILFFPKLLEPLVSLKKLFFPHSPAPGTYCSQPFPQPDDYAKKELGLWIKSHTQEGDRVLVAGYGAIVQAYSQRRSPTSFFNVTQTRMAKEMFLHEIDSARAGMILVPEFAEYAKEVGQDVRKGIENLVRKGYHFDRCFYGYSIYIINKEEGSQPSLSAYDPTGREFLLTH